MVIDTDILIDFLRGVPAARDFLLALPDDALPGCSVITVAEIHAGMKESERERTQALLASLAIWPVTTEVAEMAGTFKREARGFDLCLDDCLIAATATTEARRLATRNSKHYPMDRVTLVVPEY